MNCGSIEVFQIHQNSVHVIVDAKTLPEQLFENEAEITANVGEGYYASVPDSLACDFAAEDAGDVLPRLQKSHISIISKALRSQLILGRKKAHSPGVIEYLEDLLGQKLPQPTYLDPSQEAQYQEYLNQWNSVIEFHDGININAHDLFQRWRRDHWDSGYFANRKSRNNFLLHRVSCAHPGDGEWSSDDVGEGLTNTKKICAEEPQELLSWIREQYDVEPVFCKDCIKKTDLDYIKSLTKDISQNSLLQLPDIESDAISAIEGRKKFVTHLQRERKPWLVEAKKTKVLNETGRLACEACGFDFRKVYGEDFAEAHHRAPLSAVETDTETTLDDLAVLCANCHRMIHRTKPMESIEQFRKRLARFQNGARND